MSHPYRKKMIEVALPLEEINIAAAREKSIRHGHPSTLHLWWARRPLASCRAVIFASIIDDPDQEGVPAALLERIDLLPIPVKYQPEWESLSEGGQRRKKVFGFIEQLVQWENSNDPDTLQTAHELIHAATGGNPPPLLDPFAGGGSIPLEAQRLGLEAHASDLNPVAVLINKAMIEIPPKFAGQPPVNPEAQAAGGKSLTSWRGAQGLAEDVRYYGKWMRDEAEKRIGYLYPKAKLPLEYGGGEATVIAWIWARTVVSPNPAAHGAHVPLIRSFALSTKKGKEAWVEPVADTETMTYRFEVRTSATHPGGAPRGATIGRKGGVCLLTGVPMDLKYVRAQGQAGKMKSRLMAVVAEGKTGRIYITPTEEDERIAEEAVPSWKPDGELPKNPRDFKTPNYGMTHWAELFTARQLTALSTFSSLVKTTQEKVKADADILQLKNSQSYADAVATYLVMAIDKCADYHCTIASWASGGEFIRGTFARQAIVMTWDFAECNIFSHSTANWTGTTDWVVNVIERLPTTPGGHVQQKDATFHGGDKPYLITTDPPYYDNISYASLSDFFYVWLRHTLADIYPDLFETLLTPKGPELIAEPSRQGGKEASKHFFEVGMRRVFGRMCETAHPDFPVTVIYAFKQAESDGEDIGDDANHGSEAATSTGWETMLDALIGSGHQITGTWPMRTERPGKITAAMNVLASSIALVCRPRHETAPTVTRREFQSILRAELPQAVRALQEGNIAPVDLAQSAIGPGMAVFSRYAAVLEASGKPMTVRTALQVINQVLAEVMEEQEGWYDEQTRWAVAWFSQFGFTEGPYGTAETLATAKNVAVAGLVESGVLASGAGKVKLISRDALPQNYDPAKDERVTVWEITQYLARELDGRGLLHAGQLLKRFRESHPEVEPERARDLSYRLFAICDAKKWSAEARPYNALVATWGDIETESQSTAVLAPVVGGLFGEGDTE